MAKLDIALPVRGTEADKEVRALRDYVYMLSEQLRYVLQNLDESNLASELTASISASVAKSDEALAETELCRSAIEQNRQGISLRVQRDEIVSAINQSAEQIRIVAGKIALEGAVTANDNFRINTDGSMEARNGSFSGSIQASAGSLGAFSVDRAGNLAGAATLQVGGVTLSGNTAAGLRISADNLDYVEGQPPGSNEVYFLGVTDTGQLCLFDLNGSYTVRDPGSVPQTSAVNVLRITAAGDGLKKRQATTTDSALLGSCATGEVYGYTWFDVGLDGYMWARCATQYAYNASTGAWTATAITPFYCRQNNNSMTANYFDRTTVNA